MNPSTKIRKPGGCYWVDCFDHTKLHRLNGPAVLFGSYKEWWLNGSRINVSSQEEFERLLKIKSFW